MNSFWNTLAHKSTPFLGLSPMDGVTDHPTRFIQKKYGMPAVVYTEFTSVEGVCHGAERLLRDFLYDETQRPIVGQIYGTTPEFFYETALVLCYLGFDGVDINMGCPAKNVAHSGAGAALIKAPDLAQEIIRETQRAVSDFATGVTPHTACSHLTKGILAEVERRHQLLPPEFQLPRTVPVSVKTRVGYDAPVVDQWIPTLLETKPAAIAIHGRTLKQQYGGLAAWECIGQAAALAKGSGTIILGNGDISSAADAKARAAQYGVDGVLIGRATMGNPFIFLDQPPQNPSLFEIAAEHSLLYQQTYESIDHNYSFMPMRKHLGWYVKSILNASQVRAELFQANTADEVKGILGKHGLL